MKTALITGASGGIGEAIAHYFADDKYDLILVARSSDKLAQVAQELKRNNAINVRIITKDLSKWDDVVSLVEELRNEQIHFLVNNAGFGDFGLFHEADWGKTQQMINLNITALTYLTKALLPGMLQREGGHVLNVASTASFLPGPYMAVYYASKSYVLHFSEALAEELKGTGVKVTALCPGPTASGFQSAAKMTESRLVKGKKLTSANRVAAFGYKAMLRGQRVAIPGLFNVLTSITPRLLPRRLVTMAVGIIQRKK